MRQSTTVKTLLREQISERTCLQEADKKFSSNHFSSFSVVRLVAIFWNLLVSKLWCHKQEASLQHTHGSGHRDGVKVFHPDLCDLGRGNNIYITVLGVWNAAQTITQTTEQIHRLFSFMWKFKSDINILFSICQRRDMKVYHHFNITATWPN